MTWAGCRRGSPGFTTNIKCKFLRDHVLSLTKYSPHFEKGSDLIEPAAFERSRAMEGKPTIPLIGLSEWMITNNERIPF